MADDHAQRFQQTLDAFVEQFGTLPPSPVYRHHPAHRSVSSAILLFISKAFYEFADDEMLAEYAGQVACEVLHDITIYQGEFLYEGMNELEGAEYLSYSRSSRANTYAHDPEMIRHPDGSYKDSINAAIVDAALHLIRPAMPEDPTIQKAWRKLRTIHPPNHELLVNNIGWNMMGCWHD